MTRLSEQVLRQLIKGGETTTVELKAAAPRPVEMAERLCGMANAQGGMIIIGVEDAKRTIVGVPDDRMAMTIDTILRAARQNVKPALIPVPPNTYDSALGGGGDFKTAFGDVWLLSLPLLAGVVGVMGGTPAARRG